MLKMLNFRISDTLRAKLEWLIKHDKKQRTLSDLSRELIEDGSNHIINTLQRRREMLPNLLIIASKIDNDVDLEVKEINYLCEHANHVYHMWSPSFLMDPAYLLDNLSAFESLLKAVILRLNNDSFGDYISNLLGDRFNDRSRYKQEIFNNIAITKKHISNGEDVSYDYISRNLMLLVKKAQEIHIPKCKQVLNDAISPYYKSLLILAKKDFFQKEQSPLFHYPDKQCFLHAVFEDQRDEEDQVRSKYFSIMFFYNENLSGILNFHQKPDDKGEEPVTHCINLDFLEANALIKLLSQKTLSHSYWIRNRERIKLYKNRKGTYVLYFKSLTCYLNGDQYKDLQRLMLQYQEKLCNCLPQLRYQWGDI